MFMPRLLLLALAGLLAPVLAGRRAVNVVYLDAAEDSSYEWTVSHWAATNSGGDSRTTYSFNITGPYSDGRNPIPSFAAYCSGAGVGSAYALCHITDIRNTTRRRQVVAKLQPPVDDTTATLANLAVSYQFDDLSYAGTWWNYTSFAAQPYTATGPSNVSFTMKPSQVYGVA